MQRATATSSTKWLISDVVRTLNKMGDANPSSPQGFHRLHRAVQESKSEIQEEEMRGMLRNSLFPSPGPAETKTEFQHRLNQVTRCTICRGLTLIGL